MNAGQKQFLGFILERVEEKDREEVNQIMAQFASNFTK